MMQMGISALELRLHDHGPAPPRLTKHDSQGGALWERLAKGRPEIGNPSTFNSSILETFWESITVTMRDPYFLNRLEAFTGNSAGPADW
jgi:oleate hydratase